MGYTGKENRRRSITPPDLNKEAPCFWTKHRAGRDGSKTADCVFVYLHTLRACIYIIWMSYKVSSP